MTSQDETIMATERGFYPVPNSINGTDLTLAEFRLMCEILRISNNNPAGCYLGVRALAEACNMNKNTVTAVKASLIEKGLLTVQPYTPEPGTMRHRGDTLRPSKGVLKQVTPSADRVSQNELHPTREGVPNQGRRVSQNRVQNNNKRTITRKKKKKGGCNLNRDTLPAALDTPKFRAAWAEWIDARREAGHKRYTARGEAAQLKRLAMWGEAAALASIAQSIAQGWQGLFEPKTDNAKRREVGRGAKHPKDDVGF